MQIQEVEPPATPVCTGLDPPREPGLVRRMDALAVAAETQLGSVTQSPALFGTLYYLGDGLQREAIDQIFELLEPAHWTPAGILRSGCAALRRVADITRLLSPIEADLSWRELTNKLEIFQLVRNLPSQLGLAAEDLSALPDLVTKAYSMSPFAALWAVEGVGHFYTERYWKHKSRPQGMLREAEVPTASLLMLHAGMGLAFADGLLRDLSADAPAASDVRAAIAQFLELCQSNSKPGYLGAAIESLGLVTRDFYPDLLASVSGELQRFDRDLSGFFWHGVGRALYFSRRYFLSIFGSVTSILTDPILGSPERECVIAGLAWAFTLVNMLDPAIMEYALRSGLPSSEGFTNGLVSSVLVRQETTPNEEFISRFYRYQPQAATNARTWVRLVRAPVETAFRTYYPVLQHRAALDQIFRFQNLSVIAAAWKDMTAAHVA